MRLLDRRSARIHAWLAFIWSGGKGCRIGPAVDMEVRDVTSVSECTLRSAVADGRKIFGHDAYIEEEFDIMHARIHPGTGASFRRQVAGYGD